MIVGFIWNVGMFDFLSIFFELLCVSFSGWFVGIINGFLGIVWIVCCLIFGFFLLVFLFFMFFIVEEFVFLLILLFNERVGFIIWCGEIDCVLSLGLCIGDSFFMYFVVIFCFILGGVGMCLCSLLMVYCKGI